MRTRLAWLVLVGALAFGAMVPPTAEVQDGNAARFTELRERLDGHWVLAVSQAQAQQTVDQAIERAVAAMNMLLRGVARPLIRDATPVNRFIVLQFADPDRITCRFDTGRSYTTPLGATRTGDSNNGETLRVTHRYRDGSLEQVFEADQGTRWNLYRPLPDGRVRVDATINGDMMPQPMRFSLTYRRR